MGTFALACKRLLTYMSIGLLGHADGFSPFLLGCSVEELGVRFDQGKQHAMQVWLGRCWRGIRHRLSGCGALACLVQCVLAWPIRVCF